MSDERTSIQSNDEIRTIAFSVIAEKVHGEPVGFVEDFMVEGVTTLDRAQPGWLSFVTAKKFCDEASSSGASGFLTTRETLISDRPCIVLDNVWKGMLFLLDHFHGDPPPEPGVHPTAIVDAEVSLGEGVWIGPYAIVEAGAQIGNGVQIGAHCVVGRNVRIGDGAVLHPRATVLHNCEVGRRVILHPGAVIGADGFKYEIIDGKLVKIPQVGRVVLEDDAEIGANTCIDRASFAETRVAAGAKIDNLCQLGHNVTVGQGAVMAAQVGVAGSTHVGSGCYLGGQVGLRDNIRIGDRAKIGAQSGVNVDIPAEQYYFGTPALPVREYMSMVADSKKIGDLRKRLRAVEKILEKMSTP